MSAKGASSARSSAMRPSTRLLKCWLWVLTGSSFTKREKRQLSAKPTQGNSCSHGCEKPHGAGVVGLFFIEGKRFSHERRHQTVDPGSGGSHGACQPGV